ncbi:MAG TPA: autotransporter outer membrane beta-barrel domain-containing protein [Chryseolinea sp.]
MFTKRITLFVIAMVASLGAFAQFNKGRMLVGGSAEFRTMSDKDKTGGTTTTNGNRTTLSISPSFGYFIIDQLAVGAAVDMSLSKWNAKDAFDDDNNTTSIQFQPFVRYYLPMGIFFQGKFGVGTAKTTYDDRGDSKYNTSSLALSAGYAIFLSDNVAIEPELGYRTSKFKNTDSDTKNLNSGLFLRVGFQIYLGNR